MGICGFWYDLLWCLLQIIMPGYEVLTVTPFLQVCTNLSCFCTHIHYIYKFPCTAMGLYQFHKTMALCYVFMVQSFGLLLESGSLWIHKQILDRCHPDLYMHASCLVVSPRGNKLKKNLRKYVSSEKILCDRRLLYEIGLLLLLCVFYFNCHRQRK